MTHLESHDILKLARDGRRLIRIEYRKGSAWQPGVERDIEVHRFDDKYVEAYCRLRQDPRVFRVDRIVRATLLAETFSIDPEIEGHIDAHGWAGRTDAWRRERMGSIQLDKLCDRVALLRM